MVLNVLILEFEHFFDKICKIFYGFLNFFVNFWYSSIIKWEKKFSTLW